MSPYITHLRESFVISFSPELAIASAVKKQDALDDLIKVIENHTPIEDESVEAFQLMQNIFDLFVSYGQQAPSGKSMEWSIRRNSLTPHAMQEIESLGFHVLR